MNNKIKINNTSDLFNSLKIDSSVINNDQLNSLNEKGYVIFPPNKIMTENLKTLNNISDQLILQEGDKGGWEGKQQYYKSGKKFEHGADRLGNLIEKHDVFRKIILLPEMLYCAKKVINDDIKIVAAHLRSPTKNSGYQRIHIDGYPRYKDTDPYSGIIAFIYLDDSTIENGALRIIPSSHKKLGWPNEHIDINKTYKDELNVEVKAGTVVIANLNLWHRGGNNTSGKPRKMIMINIKNRKELQLLNFKKYLSDKTKNTLTEEQRYLLAVRDVDPTQKEDSAGGVNFLYRQKYGNYKKDN